jgi:hypothetical protein
MQTTRTSPNSLHDWGRLQGTPGDSRGLDSWNKATSCQALATKVVRHQWFSFLPPIGFESRWGRHSTRAFGARSWQAILQGAEIRSGCKLYQRRVDGRSALSMPKEYCQESLAPTGTQNELAGVPKGGPSWLPPGDVQDGRFSGNFSCSITSSRECSASPDSSRRAKVWIAFS